MSQFAGCEGAACSPFTIQCRANLLKLDPIPGLVDGSGNPINKASNATWGVSYPVCQQYCGFSDIPMVSQPEIPD